MLIIKHRATTKKLIKIYKYKEIKMIPWKNLFNRRECNNGRIEEWKDIVSGKMADINPPVSLITLNVSRVNSQMAEIGIWLYKRGKYDSSICFHFRFKEKIGSQ